MSVIKEARKSYRIIDLVHLTSLSFPSNLNPSCPLYIKSEIETRLPYLETQIALINPKIIVTLGNVITQHLLETTQGITKLRGQWFVIG